MMVWTWMGGDVGRKEEQRVAALRVTWAREDAREAYNRARRNRRDHGIPDPEYDFTGEAGVSYQVLCLQGIHILGENGLTCQFCGDLIRGVPSDLPTTDVKGTSTSPLGHNAR